MLAPTPVAAVSVLSKPVTARPSLTVRAAYAEPLVAPRTSISCAPTVVPEGMVTVFEIVPSALAVVERSFAGAECSQISTDSPGVSPLALTVT